MGLSNDLISQFVKITNDTHKTTKKETITYGTIKEYRGSLYVQLDGSELLTPISTTADAKPDDRVTVMIKNHNAVVTGNMSSPSASSGDVSDVARKISEFEIVLAYRVTATDLEAINAIIEKLRAKVAEFDNMSVVDAAIVRLQAKYAYLDRVDAETVAALNADIENIRARFGDFANVSTEDLEAFNAEIDNLRSYNASFTYVSADVLHAINAKVDNMDVGDLSANYANINFSNIGKAAIENFFATSGLIKDVVVGDGTVTGHLVGVTISGDLIEGNTVKAEKLVIKGEDGLYYKLNIDGGATVTEEVSEEELQNGLSGTIIIAKSITADKISVDDLVAFDATIGGFNINDSAIYSGVKETVDNTTAGVYLDKTGQVVIGDATNYLRYFKDTDGKYKLAISASSVVLSTSEGNVATVIEGIQNEAVTSVAVEYALSSSSTTAPTSGWSTTAPEWIDGQYMWQKTTITLMDGTQSSSNATCITGATGPQGIQGVAGKDGAAGETGATGQGVASITAEYYLSTSKATQTGGSWLTAMPTWTPGTYLWIRNKIVYKNPTSTAYTSPYCDSSWEAVNEIAIGGRNLIIRSESVPNACYDQNGEYTETTSYGTGAMTSYIPIEPGMDYTFSRAAGLGDYFRFNWYDADKTYLGRKALTEMPLGEAGSYTWTAPDTACFLLVSFPWDVASKAKLERGNKATDWTPAPEDMATGEEVTEAQKTSSEALGRVAAAESTIQQLADSISMLVTDGTGASLMTQTESGWTFSTAEIQSVIDSASANLDTLVNEVGNVSSAVGILQEAVSDLGTIAEYVKITTYEDEPCIELGESDSDFKLIITNTRIMFMDGSDVPAYISNKSLYIKTAVVEEELHQGGFVWKTRSNGHLSLVWKGVTE